MNTYNGLLFTTKEINSNFKIKVNGLDQFGKKINKLVGVAGLIALIGVDFVNKFVKRAMEQSFFADKVTCKLRRGIKVTFYVW